MFIRIKHIKKKGSKIKYPYYYLIEAYWDKKLNKPRQRVISYLGKAEIGKLDISKINMNCCEICGSIENLTIDHIIPLSKKGTNENSNLRCLCLKCNQKKRNLER